MNFKTTSTALIAILFILTSLVASRPLAAQQMAPGQIDLAPIAVAINQKPKVNLNFGSVMVRAFAEGVRPSNAQIARLLDTVAGVRVMVYENIDGALVRDRVAETVEGLGLAGWAPAMEVRDQDAHVDLYLNESGDAIDGLVLMVTESNGAAVFINVFGRLDPVVIGKLVGNGLDLGNLNLDGLMGRLKDSTTGQANDES
ncbi:MAG: DUF4252 domain-containing protein [Wenzhouxiangellaceae bacterium]